MQKLVEKIDELTDAGNYKQKDNKKTVKKKIKLQRK